MTDVSHLNVYITWLITAVAGAFGIGIGYAVLKTDLANFKHEFQAYRDATSASASGIASTAAATSGVVVATSEQLISLKERVYRIEGKQESQVGWVHCREMRDDCGERIGAQLAEITKQITNNRDVVVAQMKESDKFIGRVEQFIKNNNGK